MLRSCWVYPVDGEVLVGSTELNWFGLCLQLLGVSPPPNKLDGSRLNMKWLQDTFGVLPDDANEVTVQQYTRAYILELLGGSYFADKSGEKVHLMFLPMLEDFDAAGRCGHGLDFHTYHLAIKSIQPIVNVVDDANANANANADTDADADVEVPADAAQPLPGGPYGTRWCNAKDINDVSTHVLEQYRSDFSRQRPDQEVWRSVTPLICFQIVEWHLPNRALRQFGMQQDIPQPANTDVKLHDCDLRGKVHENWRQRWRHYISIWDHRREHVVTRDKMVGLMAYHDPYMDWYLRITRRFISRRSGCYEMMQRRHINWTFNALEASNELHRLDSVERVNTDSDTNTHTTVPPTATRRRRPRAQRPPHPRAQRPSRPSDPSSSMSVPPILLVGPSSPRQSVGPSSVTQSVVPTSVTQSGGPTSATQLSGPARALPQPSGPSSATQLEDLVRDIEVGDHGRGRGRDRAPKKSVSEDPRKKRLKSKAQRDEAPSLDNTFTSSEHAEFLAPVLNVILQIVGVQFEGYSPLESIRQMCGNPNIEELSRPKIADLTLESRLIHHIIAHNILPRSGSYEYTSYLDLFILWCILNKVKLDLAFYIGWHMDTCVKKKNGALPYGLQITTILNHFGVDLSGEKETRDVSHKDVYGETTMRQMRYEFKDDTWVKKNAPVMEQVGEEAQMDEAEAAGNEERNARGSRASKCTF
uniref:Aminotransferase-like plant mobile domain-containing protein n=1 Tax=Fagus sylvatica TaxID=28930 RepID=A0A2N9G5I4_FAGSY